MIVVRPENQRGKSESNWLNSKHSFSFAEYFDPEHMGFSCLRVINEDEVMPETGFGFHSHKNMEIISYVIDGALEHKDNMGTGSVIKPWEIQRMSAGTGVQHSEFNHSKTEKVHFLQIWIIPKEDNIKPSYQQENIPQDKNQLILIASNQKLPGVIYVHQDIQLYVAYLSTAKQLDYQFARDRCGWLQLVKGTIQINDAQLSAGDGAAITDQDIQIQASIDSEFLLFDLPK